MSKIHGGVERDLWRWKELFSDNDSWVVIVRNSNEKIEGYLNYTLQGYGDRLFGPNNVGTISVREWYFLTSAAKHALFHFLYLHQDQIVQIWLPINPNEPNLYGWLNNFTKVSLKQHLVNMVRIIDVEKCLQDLPIQNKGRESIKAEFKFRITDSQCPWNTGVYQLKICENKLDVEKFPVETINSSKLPEFTIQGITSLIYGYLSLEEIAYFGWLKNSEPNDRDMLQTWFPKAHPWVAEFY
ncbi:MAG: GNAT family N-acetyltransferase [Promethearchaeota archaeon]